MAASASGPLASRSMQAPQAAARVVRSRMLLPLTSFRRGRQAQGIAEIDLAAGQGRHRCHMRSGILHVTGGNLLQKCKQI